MIFSPDNKIRQYLIFKLLAEVKIFCVIPGRSFSYLVYRIKTVIRDHFGDKRLGIITIGGSKFDDNLSLHKDGIAYQATPYDLIKKLIDYLKVTPDDVFIDFGCGKGRVVFSIARYKLKKVIGVELRKDLADIAMRNLRNLKSNKTLVEIINADAATFAVNDGTMFFMFNPFGQATLDSIVQNIKNSLVANPRSIRITYYGGANHNLLDKHGWLKYEGRINNMPVHFWHN